VESVPAHACIVVSARQTEAARERTHRVMKRGIKARNLGHIGCQSRAGANCRKIMRLMQRRERFQLAQLRHDLIVDANGRNESGTAMHDTMADRLDRVLAMAL